MHPELLSAALVWLVLKDNRAPITCTKTSSRLFRITVLHAAVLLQHRVELVRACVNQHIFRPCFVHAASTTFNVQIDVVLGFHNGGDETLNVTNVIGSINSPAAFNIFVQNFSAAVRVCLNKAGARGPGSSSTRLLRHGSLVGCSRCSRWRRRICRRTPSLASV